MLYTDKQLVKELNAKWTTARGVAKWARRNIGWNYDTFDSGERYCISGHWDTYKERHYVALIVYGSGNMELTKKDLKAINKVFNQAVRY